MNFCVTTYLKTEYQLLLENQKQHKIIKTTTYKYPYILSDAMEAMLACFLQVTFTRAGIADQGPLVSLLTTVLEDTTGDQGDEEPFIFISDDDSDSESDENDTSAPSTPVKKLRSA
ncbi:hypothetical protein RO3G_12667 [Rhizopus delemar RA 99-880]|uniref:Uncharacterized protein n=1 Tax=Rhizopus delemar (strain RA 99-880 / ATCC MYA-4621 / FGSC 9543 / NRRL 43880) TaxID=246409 RepID=I1CHM6_RHIO9|nr:hypothetical protein RO3G_12667 [Rhizopus delemar RA 99-880]|eukprot:EIE87956.1 hypothetical protein RO3G_12667 [Rhizopus delemar RA 99-880]